MLELPSDTIFEIFSRLPIKSLARFQCVCKEWCEYINDPHLTTIHVKEEPIPIMFHKFTALHSLPCGVNYLSVIESKEVTNSLECKKDLIFAFPCNRLTSRFSAGLVLGCCNELVLSSLEQSNNDFNFVVIHPLKKECYDLPPIKNLSMISCYHDEDSCGIGFDDSTKTFKIVCVLERKVTLVHVLGTNLWKTIDKFPSIQLTGEGVSAYGCLHWLEYTPTIMPAPTFMQAIHTRKLIYFDMKKEEFGVIDPPKLMRGSLIRQPQLVDLNGEVGVVYNVFISKRRMCIQVWILKHKEWRMHYEIDQRLLCTDDHDNHDIKVIGLWNNDGDILMSANEGQNFFVYRLKRRVLQEVNIIGMEVGGESDVRMYRRDMFSIKSHSGKMLPVSKFH